MELITRQLLSRAESTPRLGEHHLVSRLWVQCNGAWLWAGGQGCRLSLPWAQRPRWLVTHRPWFRPRLGGMWWLPVALVWTSEWFLRPLARVGRRTDRKLEEGRRQGGKNGVSEKREAFERGFVVRRDMSVWRSMRVCSVHDFPCHCSHAGSLSPSDF